MAEKFGDRRLAKLSKPTKARLFPEIKRVRRNRNRLLRRRRSKRRYLNHLKSVRCSNFTDQVIESLSVIDLTGMSSASAAAAGDAHLRPVPPEVVEWQHQSQLAYWKSRALSLQYENQMLHQHIRNMYARQIQDCANTRQAIEDGEWDDEEDEVEEVGYDEAPVRHRKQTGRRNVEAIGEQEVDANEMEQKFAGVEARKNLEEKRRLYGEGAPKIMGMETAIQLNFDFQKEKGDAANWPNLPLNL